MAIDQDRRNILNQAIAAVGTGGVSAAAVARQSGVSDPTAMTALKRAGFMQEKRGVWRKPLVIEPVKIEYPEIERAKALSQVAEPAAQERHFLDDEDSWTIPVPKKLQAMADLMGLNIEVRVWKSKP